MKLPELVNKRLTLPPARMFLRLAVQQSMISLGAVLSALGYVVFQLPFKIAAGGLSGLGIIVNELTGFPVGMFFLLFNIPLIFFGYFHLGKWRFVTSTAVAVTVFSIATDLFTLYLPGWTDVYPVTQDALLSAIYAGVLFGIGMGIIYRYGGTIGGSSIPARIIHNRTGFPMSQAYLFTDLAIILIAGFLFSLEKALLAVITLILVGIFSDFVLEGPSQMRTVLIITENPEPVRYALVNELRRGVSYWNVYGGYTHKERTLIYLTVLRSRIYDVKYIVSRIDPEAFMVVGVSQQTWGGFNAPRISG